MKRSRRGDYRCDDWFARGSENNLQNNSIQFSLFPAHIIISYSNNNVYILGRKGGRQKTMLIDVRPLTITSTALSQQGFMQKVENNIKDFF